MVKDGRTVLVAGEGALADALAAHFGATGWRVERSGTAVGEPLDLCVIADGWRPGPARLEALSRTALAAALERLTCAPFQLAARLRGRLAAAGGRLVLLSSAAARMEQPDTTGLYLDRPFRAAAHALWRCLSVEWAADGIAVGLLGLEPDAEPELGRLVAAIEGQGGATGLVELTDLAGIRLGW